jgi:hypothetical protein
MLKIGDIPIKGDNSCQKVSDLLAGAQLPWVKGVN